MKSRTESRSPMVSTVLFSPRVQHGDPLRDQQGCQGDVLGDHQIPGLGLGRDVLIRHVGSPVDPDGGHQRVTDRGLQPLIGHEDGADPEPFGRAEDELLHIARGSVSINPDLQTSSVAGQGAGVTTVRKPPGPIP